MSSDYDEGYRAGLQKSRDVARPHIEAMEDLFPVSWVALMDE